MTYIEELRARLYDAEGEAGACNDRDCSCKHAVGLLRDELAEAEAEQPCPNCGGTHDMITRADCPALDPEEAAHDAEARASNERWIAEAEERMADMKGQWDAIR